MATRTSVAIDAFTNRSTLGADWENVNPTGGTITVTATVRVLSGQTRLEPGDRVRVLPNHSCVVSNLVDEVCLVDGATVVETLPVAARGKIA